MILRWLDHKVRSQNLEVKVRSYDINNLSLITRLFYLLDFTPVPAKS